MMMATTNSRRIWACARLWTEAAIRKVAQVANPMPPGFHVTLLARTLAFQNPVRGDMFIEMSKARKFSFCFSAARLWAQFNQTRDDHLRSRRIETVGAAAPLKNKKNLCGVARLYKHATPGGVSTKPMNYCQPFLVRNPSRLETCATTLSTALWICACLLLALAFPAAGADKESPAARVERAFYQAQARFNKNATDPDAAWQFARSCFDWADLASSNGRRAE